MTLGFNIAINISLDPRFSSMIGLTHEKVLNLMIDIKEERALVTTLSGENLDILVLAKLINEQTDKFYGTLVPKMKRLLANTAGERKPRQKKERVQNQ